MKNETLEEKTQRAREILRKLKRSRPDARLELNFTNPLELLIATVLAAQATDVKVNEVTQSLFRKYRTAADYANANLAELEQEVRETGFYHQKARALVAIGKDLIARFGGQVPNTIGDLVSLPGVGRKTANVVLGNALGISAGVVVDRHGLRVAGRTDLSRETTAEKVEADLMELLPKRDWTAFGVQVTLHGRYICVAGRPFCSKCPILDLCPQVGVTNPQ